MRPFNIRLEAAFPCRGSEAAMGTNSTDAAANRARDDGEHRNLLSISPFFIVKDLQVSIAYYIERLGFRLDFQRPEDDAYSPE